MGKYYELIKKYNCIVWITVNYLISIFALLCISYLLFQINMKLFIIVFIVNAFFATHTNVLENHYLFMQKNGAKYKYDFCLVFDKRFWQLIRIISIGFILQCLMKCLICFLPYRELAVGVGIIFELIITAFVTIVSIVLWQIRIKQYKNM